MLQLTGASGARQHLEREDTRWTEWEFPCLHLAPARPDCTELVGKIVIVVAGGDY